MSRRLTASEITVNQIRWGKVPSWFGSFIIEASSDSTLNFECDDIDLFLPQWKNVLRILDKTSIEFDIYS